MSVKENLIAAKALIDTPEKWGREEYLDSVTGCMCVIGSVAATMGIAEADVEVSTAEGKSLARALPEGWERDTYGVVKFNDHPDTTHADIMSLFDRAIESCED